MGLEVLKGGDPIGELPVDLTDIATNPYFGGAPIAMQTTGLVRLAKSADDQAFIGLSQNSSSEDALNGNATVVINGCYVRMFNGSLQVDSPTPGGDVVEGAPYDTTKTFLPSQRLYIDANGLWTNVVDAGKEKGIVTKGNTAADDAVEAIIFPTNLRATA